MTEFLHLTPPDEALRLILSHIEAHPVPEETSAELALGRVTAAPVRAPHPLPEFRRSTVDGYAVRAADTYGASESLPAYLTLVGEVHMGQSANLELGAAECVLIHTGGMLPEGADAVVMVLVTIMMAQLLFLKTIEAFFAKNGASEMGQNYQYFFHNRNNTSVISFFSWLGGNTTPFHSRFKTMFAKGYFKFTATI